MKKLVLGLVAGLVVASASPASAALTLGTCASAVSCLFKGTILTSPTTPSKTGYLDAEAVYNAAHPGAPIVLSFLTSANDDIGSITNAGTTSGTWTLDGFSVDFIAIEAPRYTVLQSVGGVSSGDWNTDDIPSPPPGAGSPKIETNILFFGSVIDEGGGTALPEPSTWAMLLAGLFGLGALIRGRKEIARA